MWCRKDQFLRWQQAYDYSGRGSTEERKAKINEIFDISVPDFTAETMTDAQKETLDVLCQAVEDVLNSHNAVLVSEE